jgi:NADH:ubiquinone oxidoreductase subunit 3 (subunit A)
MNSHPYALLALFATVAVAVPLVLLGVAQLWFRLFQPAKPGAVKNDVYECGVAPSGDSWIQLRPTITSTRSSS